MDRVSKSYQNTLKKMFDLASEIAKEFDWDKYRKIDSILDKWNDKHPECEIFVCDYTLDKDGNETNKVTGIVIEDDVFYFSDEV